MLIKSIYDKVLVISYQKSQDGRLKIRKNSKKTEFLLDK